LADDLVVTTAADGDVSSVPTGTRFSAEELTTLNGSAITAALAQRIVLALRTADGTAVDVTDIASGAKQDTGNTSLASILAKIIASPATEAKQDTIIGHVDGIESAFTTLNAKDFATQTTLAALLAKVIAAPSTEAKQDSMITLLTSLESYLNGLATSGETQPVSLASVPSHAVTNAGTFAVQNTAATPAGTNNIGDVDVLTLPALVAGTATIGVVINERVSTATVTSVADSASSIELLASTAGRKGASFFNDSDQAAYVKLGTTASATDFTIKMAAASFYELPQPVYTGKIDAIWVSNSTGSMRITELT
jgi:hypothetical protein